MISLNIIIESSEISEKYIFNLIKNKSSGLYECDINRDLETLKINNGFAVKVLYGDYIYICVQNSLNVSSERQIKYLSELLVLLDNAIHINDIKIMLGGGVADDVIELLVQHNFVKRFSMNKTYLAYNFS